MSHLTLEALARVLDETPGEAERAHLSACAACREELEGLRGQTEALSALPSMVPAPDQWPDLRERLRAERLVRDDTADRPSRPTTAVWSGTGARGLRAAAAVFLFVAGGALGYTVRGEGLDGAAVTGPQVGTAAEPGQALAGVDGGANEESPDLWQVEEAQEAFFSALDRYMAATGTEPADPAARLAALDNIVLTTAEALNEAPADPVINSFYLTAMAQRNAMFRQMTASPDPVF